jgi:hypothetical protein
LRSLPRLLGSYVVATILAAIILAAGLWVWMKLVAPENWLGAWFISELTLLLLLIPRFWQRGIAVSYWQQKMLVPIAIPAPVVAGPIVVAPIVSAPVAVGVPVTPAAPSSPAPEGAPDSERPEDD